MADAIPESRTVVQFNLRGAHRGRRTWLLLDPMGTTVCERDEGFDVDLWVDANIREFLRVWMGGPAGVQRWKAVTSGSTARRN